LNLCGSAVSVEAVKEVLDCCQALISINLSSCRGLPRGIKRLLEGKAQLNELRENLKNGD
jgi:F-box/leucine-rich repeat protein 6